MPPSTEPVSSETDLVEFLQSLNIAKNATSTWVPDVYLTRDAINTAFDALPAQFLLIHGVFGNPTLKTLIPGNWATLKSSLITALCQPYRDAVILGETNNATKDLEISQLRKQDLFKDAQIAQLLEQNISKDSQVAQLVRQNTSADPKITKLLEKNTSKDSQIARLITDIDRDRETISEQRARLKKLENDADYLRSENQRLRQQTEELLSARQHLGATITRTQTWKEAMEDSYNRMYENLPKVYDVICNDEVTALSSMKYVKDPAMYIRLQKCLAEHLTTPIGETPGSTVFDTHSMEVINGLKPDITIVTADCSHPVAQSVIAIVELKNGSLDNDSFGQLYSYLKTIEQAQPHRRIIIGLLSNLGENQFLTLESVPGQRPRCIRYNPVTLDIALSYLQSYVISSSLYHPPISPFSPDLGPRGVPMGNPAFSTLAAFDILSTFSQPAFKEGRWVDESVELPTGHAQIVVKRTALPLYGMSLLHRAPRSVRNEITILRDLQGKPRDEGLPGWKHLPKLFYHTDDFQEFGMLPRGSAIRASDSHVLWPKVLVDVLDALQWLHTQHIIHRDVRLGNIIWDIDHAVLIDLGAAIDVTNRGESNIQFCGGYVCCPPGLIGQLNALYIPCFADDCLAFVLLVNTILFPARWEGFRSCELEKPGSPETRMLGEFWRKLATSQIWRSFYKAACAADYDGLKKMVELFVCL